MSRPSISLPTGHTVEYLKDEDNERRRKFIPTNGDMIRLQPGGWFFEECMPPILERIYNYPFKSTDVIALTFPKSGTTWSQEVLWTFLHNPNLDNPEAKISIDLRSSMLCGDLLLNVKYAAKLAGGADLLKNAICQVDPNRVNDEHLLFTYTELCLKNPRVIKTHLPISLLPPTALKNSKIVFVTRDPRDVITSRFNWFKLMKFQNFLGTLDDFLDLFLNEELFYQPYWQHLKEAWDLRQHPNLLFILYEDLLMEPLREYERVNKFLGLNLTETQVKNIIEYTSFENMKKRYAVDDPMSDGGNLINEDAKKSAGGYFRKGKVGDWKDKFTPEQVEKVNNWIKNATKDFPRDVPYLVKE